MAFHAIRRLALACLCVCATGAHAATPVYRLTLIPPLGGVTECHLGSLNDLGQVAGTCFNGGGAFLWSASTGSLKITDPAHPDDVLIVGALNKLGQVAGTRYWVDSGGNHERGFVWDAAAGITYFGEPDSYWHVTGLNDAQVAAGFRGKQIDGERQWTACTWSAPDGVTKLRPYAHRVTYAFDINNSGQAVGTIFDKLSLKTHSVIFEPDGSATRIPLPLHRWDEPRAISDSGHVTGHMAGPSQSDHAFLWRPGAAPIDIDPRSARGDYSYGMDINDADEVVGTLSWWVDKNPVSSAFHWDPANGMVDLMTLIDPDDPLRGQIDSLGFDTESMRINNHGQIALTARMLDGSVLPLLFTPVP